MDTDLTNNKNTSKNGNILTTKSPKGTGERKRLTAAKKPKPFKLPSDWIKMTTSPVKMGDSVKYVVTGGSHAARHPYSLYADVVVGGRSLRLNGEGYRKRYPGLKKLAAADVEEDGEEDAEDVVKKASVSGGGGGGDAVEIRLEDTVDEIEDGVKNGLGVGAEGGAEFEADNSSKRGVEEVENTSEDEPEVEVENISEDEAEVEVENISEDGPEVEVENISEDGPEVEVENISEVEREVEEENRLEDRDESIESSDCFSFNLFSKELPATYEKDSPQQNPKPFVDIPQWNFTDTNDCINERCFYQFDDENYLRAEMDAFASLKLALARQNKF